MKCIVGLGNPGKEYAKHRHTIGFVLVDTFVHQHGGVRNLKKDLSASVAECVVGGQKVIFAKPLLYMNRSGGPVQQIAHFYKIAPKNILVIHDEIDFPVAKIALKFGGRSGGHNGLKDIIASLGTQDFWRLRIGVGRPSSSEKETVVDYVLHDFGKAERDALDDKEEEIMGSVLTFLAM